MIEIDSNIYFSVLFMAAVSVVFGVNFYYQRKARFYADEMLRDNPVEFNKQIKANAYRSLFSSLVWSAISLLILIWNYELIISGELSYAEGFFFGVDFLLGIFLIFWGVHQYYSEMKRTIKVQ